MMILVSNLSAMEKKLTSQGKYEVDYVRKAEQYLEELKNADEVTDAMRERGARIKQGLDAQGNMNLQRAITLAELKVQRRAARGDVGGARRRLDL